jgi:hypothetical protein
MDLWFTHETINILIISNLICFFVNQESMIYAGV